MDFPSHELSPRSKLSIWSYIKISAHLNVIECSKVVLNLINPSVICVYTQIMIKTNTTSMHKNPLSSSQYILSGFSSLILSSVSGTLLNVLSSEIGILFQVSHAYNILPCTMTKSPRVKVLGLPASWPCTLCWGPYAIQFLPHTEATTVKLWQSLAHIAYYLMHLPNHLYTR